MRIKGKSFDKIESQDILDLMENGYQENIILDYKKDLGLLATKIDNSKQVQKDKLEKDKIDILTDISAMANTEGGIIIYGLEEEKDSNGLNTGKPKQVSGIKGLNIDFVRNRISNALQLGLNPPLNFKSTKIIFADGKEIFLLGVQKSLLAPHMIIKNDLNCFYRRNDTGNYIVGLEELKRMFLEAEEWENAAESFRQSRIELLYPSTHFSGNEIGAVIVHVIPIARQNERIDLINYKASITDMIGDLMEIRNEPRISIEGLHFEPFTRAAMETVNIYRNGTIEAIWDHIVRHEVIDDEKIGFIRGLHMFEFIIKSVNFARQVLPKMNIELPLAIFVSFKRVKNLCISLRETLSYKSEASWTDAILIPSCIVQEWSEDFKDNLMPTFHLISQAFGKENNLYREAL